jgi:hypothetical protein
VKVEGAGGAVVRPKAVLQRPSGPPRHRPHHLAMLPLGLAEPQPINLAEEVPPDPVPVIERGTR